MGVSGDKRRLQKEAGVCSPQDVVWCVAVKSRSVLLVAVE